MIDDKFIESFEVDDWEVETDSGWEEISHSNKTIPFVVWELFTNSFSLKCADDHIVNDENFNQVFVKDLQIGQKIITKNGLEEVKLVRCLNYEDNMYDLTVNSKNHTYFTSGILSHNTTVSALYLVHYAIFNEHKTIAVLANKEKTALEIMKRIKMIYEGLPLWLQPGIVDGGWNKQSITLGNGTTILAASTASSGIRGFAINCLSGDNKVTIRDKFTGEIKFVSINELKILLNENNLFQIIIKNNRYEILTPSGFKDFDGLYEQENKEVMRIITEDSFLETTLDHEIYISLNEKKKAINIKINDDIVSANNEKSKVKDIIYIKEKKSVFDLINVKDEHRFFANDLLVSNCLFLDEFAFVPPQIAKEFMNSVYPTVSSSKTSKIIIVSTPNGMNHFYNIWLDAIRGKNSYFPVKINWWEVPGRDENFKKEIIRNQGITSWNQEYNCASFGSKINIKNKLTNECVETSLGDLWEFGNGIFTKNKELVTL